MPSTASASVRAMITNCIIGARIDGRLDAIDHLLLRHHFLAGPMAAALGLHLVFDVQSRGAGLDEGFHGARDVERAAPAGVRIHQQRQRAGVGDAADVDEHIVHGADAQIRHAERIGGDAAARQVQRLEAARRRHARGIGVDGADHSAADVPPARRRATAHRAMRSVLRSYAPRHRDQGTRDRASRIGDQERDDFGGLGRSHPAREIRLRHVEAILRRVEDAR